MLIEKSVKTLENLFSFLQIDPEPNVDNTLIFEEILSELEEFLLRENDNADSTDGVFEFLAEISNQIQKEFDELLGEDTNKKRFLKVAVKNIWLAFKYKS